MSTQNKTTFLLTPAEASGNLGINPNTLKKYSQLLEEKGYTIHRDNRNTRLYTEMDLTLIRKLIHRKENSNMTLDEIAEDLVSMVKEEGISPADTNQLAVRERHIDDISEMKELINKQTEFIKVLADRLEERDRYIQQRLAEQDKKLLERDNALLEGIRSLQEQREEQRKEANETLKLLVAATEEIESQKKRGFFARFFGK